MTYRSNENSGLNRPSQFGPGENSAFNRPSQFGPSENSGLNRPPQGQNSGLNRLPQNQNSAMNRPPHLRKQKRAPVTPLAAIILLAVGAMAALGTDRFVSRQQARLTQLSQAAGMVTFPVGATKGQAKLDLTVTIAPGCRYGEWEAIELERRRGGRTDSHLLLTLEPISGAKSAAPLFSARVAVDDLKRPQSISVIYNEDQAAKQPLGLFLCTATDARPGCRGKQTIRPEDVTRTYFLPRGKRGPPPAKGDRVYSFHMLVARPGAVGYFLAQSLDKPSSDSLGRFALKVYPQPAPARLAFTSGRKLMELGQFTPLRVNKDRLELALGSFDSRACASAKTPDDKD